MVVQCRRVRQHGQLKGTRRLSLDGKPGAPYNAPHRRSAVRKMPAEDLKISADAKREIGEETVISRSPSVLAAEVEGETVMMSIDQGRYFGLDHIGTDIWKRIEPPCSFGALIEALVAEYDADRATIATDVRRLLDRMAAQGVVRLA